MNPIFSLMLSLFLVLGGPGLLAAKTAPKDTQKPPPPTQSLQDLETATADLQENIKDLRRNITMWQKIQWDASLTPAEKKGWRDKAKMYLQECEAYNDLLARVDAKKLPKSDMSRRFLNDRTIFLREVQYLRETLQQP
jgi:hypothetical protein